MLCISLANLRKQMKMPYNLLKVIYILYGPEAYLNQDNMEESHLSVTSAGNR